MMNPGAIKNLRALYQWTFALFVMGHLFNNMTMAQSSTNSESIQVNCSIDQYYQNFLEREIPLVDWNPLELATLLRDTHQQVLPYTSSSREDVWDALIDLDSNPNGFIHLIYSSAGMTVPALDYGTQDTWNREHLWPQSRGVDGSGPDFTDVHHLRPADATINSARGNLFFGDCQDACTSRPATDEAAPDTGRNAEMFLPPAQVRGDIARAMFYMALRYSFQDEASTIRLELTDCTQEDQDTGKNQMGYLSELLQWHQDDPPDDTERLRNERVCSRWQGNRNVFIDFPELVPIIYGEPAERPYSCNGDEDQGLTNAPSDSVGTSSPSSSSSCGQLSPGDIQVIRFTSDNPDVIVLVAMEDLPEGLELYMTDNAWTGSGFEGNEGTVKMRLMELVPQGSVFGYGTDDYQSILYGDSWESVGNGAFALATAGDSVVLYCIDEEGPNVYHHLGGFISGTWTAAGVEQDSTTSESYKPDSLSQIGAMEISGGWDNLVYSGPTIGTKANLGMDLMDSRNWQGSNSERLIYTGGNFEILATESKSDYSNEKLRPQGESVLVSSAKECPARTRGMMVTMAALLVWSMVVLLQ